MNFSSDLGSMEEVLYTNSKISKSKHINVEPFVPQDFINREDKIELLLSEIYALLTVLILLLL